MNLNGGWVRISAQTVAVAYKTYGEDPKADSVRTIAASTESVSVLREWQEEQDREERKTRQMHEARVESGRVFTQENGDAYHPDWISRRFKRIAEVLDLPSIRLHDLRHGSATLSLQHDDARQGHGVPWRRARRGKVPGGLPLRPLYVPWTTFP